MRAIFRFNKSYAGFSKGDEKEFPIVQAHNMEQEKVGKIVERITANPNERIKILTEENGKLSKEVEKLKAQLVKKEVKPPSNKVDKEATSKVNK